MTDPKKVESLGRLALIILIAASAAVTGLRGVRPLLAAQRNLNSFQKAIEILKDAQGSVDRLDAEVRTLSEEVSRTEAILPRTINLDGFLVLMDEAAKRTGVRLVSITPDHLVDRELFREMFLEVQLRGSYSSIYGFLVSLEQGSRLLGITELHMGREGDQGQCSAQLRLALYFAREVKG